jgi:HEPN domain-containing protein
MRQANRDLEMARQACTSGFYEWASFIAQQAAEKSVKAVYHKKGGNAWGHSLVDLLTGLAGRIPVTESLFRDAKYLDKQYVPSRYPDGFGRGSPCEYFDRKDADDAIGSAGRILRFCESVLAG